MRNRWTIAGGAILVALCVMTIACEESDVTAPEGSTITLDASPATIYIDQAADEDQGQTTLFAQIIDAGGLPVSDVPLVFSTDGGLLGTINNFCADDGNCIRGTLPNSQPIPCTINDDCPELDPVTVETNDSGIATDVLLLRLVEDADQASVTVRGTSLTATESVRKIINQDTPAGSTISLIASPGTVFIDQDAGETEGQTAMVAQVLDNNGAPLAGIPLLFTTTGGRLDTVDNYCTSAGLCSRSLGPCVVDGECAVLAPEIVETDANGIATDILTLRLIEDPDSVTVTAKGSTLLTTHVVTKTVNLGPIDPDPSIDAIPPVGQRTGLLFQLDGSGSTFDPQVDPECFDWLLTHDKAVFLASSGTDNVGCRPCDPGETCSATCTDRSPAQSVLTLRIGEVNKPTFDGDLAVRLRVSDDPTINCTNTELFTPEDLGKLSPNVDTLSYAIRCDLTDPEVEAGPNVFASMANDGVDTDDDGVPDTVSITLTPALATDPEDPDLEYVWECRNAANDVFQTETAVCPYSTQGTHNVRLRVTNGCGLTTEDGLIVQVNQ